MDIGTRKTCEGCFYLHEKNNDGAIWRCYSQPMTVSLEIGRIMCKDFIQRRDNVDIGTRKTCEGCYYLHVKNNDGAILWRCYSQPMCVTMAVGRIMCKDFIQPSNQLRGYFKEE